MLRVRDIMTRDVVSLSEETSVEAAAWRLEYEAISGAPVRDRKGNVVGVLSRSDLVDPLRDGQPGKPVGDAMTAGVWAVAPDEPAIEAVRLMVETGCHRVIVIRGPGKLQGIVTTMDVMRALARGGDFHGVGAAAVPSESEIEIESDADDAGKAEAAR